MDNAYIHIYNDAAFKKSLPEKIMTNSFTFKCPLEQKAG